MKLINFSELGDERGSLVALECNKHIPFCINRVYYIFGTKAGVARGFHAHRNLKQVAVCIVGSCKFSLDDGKSKQEVILDSPTTGLLIDNLVWREMHDFSSDCVLLVFADAHYNEDDYIRNYQQFLEEVNGKK